MGHRAEKNRLRHGYKTTMSGSGEKATYRTERPPQPGQHTAHTAARTRAAYRTVKPDTGTRPPARAEWKPRHVGRDGLSPRRRPTPVPVVVEAPAEVAP